MNRKFLVSVSPAANLGAVVFATCAVSPLEALDAVEHVLREKKVVGRVLFDLLLAHGNKINRYFMADFDGRSFSAAGFKSGEADYALFAPLSAAFLKQHIHEVDSFLLTKAMRFALKNGIPV
jgi:hypothetical protein